MDLTAQFLRESLHRVDRDGWDSAAGSQLLDHVRRAVVVPVVRRSGLRGPAADQAEASGWEAAWDALRRPSARTAENPGGMVWVAVRRAVAAECGFVRSPGAGPVGARARAASAAGTAQCAPLTSGPGTPRLALLPPPSRARPWLSLEALMDGGWQPAHAGAHPAEDPEPVVAAVLGLLVDAGWDRAEAAEAIAIMADHAASTRFGPPTTRWRWVSLRLGVPQWQARRLAGLLLGAGDVPGVLQLIVLHGAGVTGDPAVQGAVRSTTSRWSAGPGEWLAEWATSIVEQGIA